ncbi:MAG: hypothetical protein IPM17_00625 [Verrucomicrobia bacterium]|nr:hypothetical protein [Verrucomicrobiota bacterium]
MKARYLLAHLLSFAAAGQSAYHAAAATLDPVILGRWTEVAGKDVRTVRVAGNFVYVAALTNLHVINVANPANPVRVGVYNSKATIRDVAVVGTYAFLAASEAGFETLDVANPTAPRRVGGYTGDAVYADRLVVTETHAYVLESWGLSIFDMQDPVLPQVTAWLEKGWLQWESIVKTGNHVCVSGRKSIDIVDVSTPSQPWRLVTYLASPLLGLEDDPDPYFNGIASSGPRLFASFTDDPPIPPFDHPDYGGLEIIDFSYPGDPQFLGRYVTFATVNGVAISGNYAYLATDAGILVIDVTDPRDPRRAGGNHQFPAQAVAVKDDKLYAVGQRGLFILQVAAGPGPARPQFAAPIQVTRNGARLTLSGPTGQTAYIQRTSNLSQWEDWVSVKLVDQPVEVTDEEAVSQFQRFYRLVLK